MELLITIDALRRSSARRITAVMPYYGYARQDRKTAGRTPISAKLVANLITNAGAHRVLTLDLHAEQIQGFFDIPLDNLYAGRCSAETIKESLGNRNLTMGRPIPAAWCAPGRSPSGSTPTSPSSTSGASGRASARS